MKYLLFCFLVVSTPLVAMLEQVEPQAHEFTSDDEMIAFKEAYLASHQSALEVCNKLLKNDNDNLEYCQLQNSILIALAKKFVFQSQAINANGE